MTQETQFSHVKIEAIKSIGFGDGSLHAAEMSNEEILELGKTIRDNYLNKVSPHAPGVCMDGRCCDKTMAGTKPQLGPKCAGGPLQTAYAAAELVPGYFGAESAQNATERIAEIGGILAHNGIVIGGHTTDGAIKNQYINPENGNPQTGCGAQEKHVPSTERVATRDENVANKAALLLGIPTETPIAVTSMVDMQAINATYRPTDMLEYEKAQNDGKNEEVLVGPHKEIAWVWNNVEGTTVDRDALSHELGKDVFVIDAWYLKKLAYVMAAGRPDAEEIFPKLVRIMAEYQLATYAELGDGSHPGIILSDSMQLAA